MILVDANLLIYAALRSLPQHDRARNWLDAQLSGSAPVGLPWPTLLAFLRVVTNPRVFERPISMADAWGQVRAWLGAEVAWIPQPGERHADILGRFVADADLQSALVPDAHLAALAFEHGLVLCSTDADFARFPGVRWRNPLRDGAG